MERKVSYTKIKKRKSQLSAPVHYSKIPFSTFTSLLSIPISQRTPQNIKVISDYLTEYNAYFIDLKNASDDDRIFKLVSCIYIEEFPKGTTIINCGDIGEKFYVLLKGRIRFCKPFDKMVELSYRDYVQILHQVRVIENDMLKFERIIKQNPNIDYFTLSAHNYDYTKIRQTEKTQKFFIEEETFLCEEGKGHGFGDMSLLKEEPRNASVYAVEDCICATVNKKDYTKVIGDLELQRLAIQADVFKKKYPLFKFWTVKKIIKLFNFFEKETFSYGEYIYRQNEPSNYLYFTNDAILEMSTILSFCWYEEFIDFIHDSSLSAVKVMLQKAHYINDDDSLNAFFEEKRKEIVSPMIYPATKRDLALNRIIDGINPKKNDSFDLLNVKLEQDELKSADKTFTAIIKQISIPECLGYEDGLEMKPRYSSIKCLSSLIEIQKVNIVQFLKLMPHDIENQDMLQKSILERKQLLTKQLRNNAQYRLSSIDHDMKDKYIRAIHKEYPNRTKKYVNDKKMIKSLKKCNSEIYHNTLKDINNNEDEYSCNASRYNSNSHMNSTVRQSFYNKMKSTTTNDLSNQMTATSSFFKGNISKQFNHNLHNKTIKGSWRNDANSMRNMTTKMRKRNEDKVNDSYEQSGLDSYMNNNNYSTSNNQGSLFGINKLKEKSKSVIKTIINNHIDQSNRTTGLFDITNNTSQMSHMIVNSLNHRILNKRKDSETNAKSKLISPQSNYLPSIAAKCVEQFFKEHDTEQSKVKDYLRLQNKKILIMMNTINKENLNKSQ